LHNIQLSSANLSKREVMGWCEQRDCASGVMNRVQYSHQSHTGIENSDESGLAFAENLDCCLVGKYL